MDRDMTGTCDHCGTKFRKKVDWQRFCCDDHRTAFHNNSGKGIRIAERLRPHLERMAAEGIAGTTVEEVATFYVARGLSVDAPQAADRLSLAEVAKRWAQVKRLCKELKAARRQWLEACGGETNIPRSECWRERLDLNYSDAVWRKDPAQLCFRIRRSAYEPEQEFDPAIFDEMCVHCQRALAISPLLQRLGRVAAGLTFQLRRRGLEML